MRRLTLCGILLMIGAPAFAQTHRLPGETTTVPHLDWTSTTSMVTPDGDAGAANASSAEGSISVAALRVPPAALKEFQKAEKSYAAKDVRGAIAHLQKGVRIYPECPEAHNELGWRYAEISDFEDAVAEFQSVAALLPKKPEPLHNESVALFALKRYSEAEAAAREVLAIDPMHQPTIYMLGRILAAERRNEEALGYLAEARATHPDAYLIRASVLLRMGRNGEAVRELEAYVDLPNAAERARVKGILEELQGKWARREW